MVRLCGPLRCAPGSPVTSPALSRASAKKMYVCMYVCTIYVFICICHKTLYAGCQLEDLGLGLVEGALWSNSAEGRVLSGFCR